MANLAHTCDLGVVAYEPTAQLQRALRAAREDGAIGDTLLILEHEPVITCGTRTEAHEVAYARTTDVPVIPVERGGKATYHGPGQLVVYPILGIDLVRGDVKDLVCRLEQAIIDTLSAFGVPSRRRDGAPGVWIADDSLARPRKIASLGLRLTRGVTFHGIAVNVDCDLDPFTWFTPCGLPDSDATSIEQELARTAGPIPTVADVRDVLLARVAEQFELDLAPFDAATLDTIAAAHAQPSPDVALPGEVRPSRIDAAQRSRDEVPA